MALVCLLCGYETPEGETQIVTHLKKMHKLKLSDYLDKFPDIPVVSKTLLSAIRDEVTFDYRADIPGLDKIGKMDKLLIIKTVQSSYPRRSEIVVTDVKEEVESEKQPAIS